MHRKQFIEDDVMGSALDLNLDLSQSIIGILNLGSNHLGFYGLKRAVGCAYSVVKSQLIR